MKISITPLTFAASLTLSFSTLAELENAQPARIFGSDMVLQCDAPIRIWGTANKNQTVTVTLGDETSNTTADAEGKWIATFAPRKASSKPISLGINEVNFSNILIGEVWICSGQSNMKFTLGSAKIDPSVLKQMENDQLRLLVHEGLPLIAKDGYSEKQLERCNVDTFFEATWTTSTTKTARGSSAIGWIFGNGLQREMDVPVGIIQVAVGGSAMNNWIDPVTAKENPLTASLYEKDWLTNEEVFAAHRNRGSDAMQNVIKKGEPYIIGKTPYRWLCEPGFLFEAGIAQLEGLSFRGVVWYQGESDATTPEASATAAQLFPLLIRSWRNALRAQDSEFIFVQLPGHDVASWPQFRESQRLAEKELPHTAMVVTLDLGDEKNIHPKDKQPVGERVLRLALKNTYGKDLLGFPETDRVSVEGKDLIICFRECGEGFLPIKGDISGFEVADQSGAFHPASAKLSSTDSITVTSPFPSPSAIRYAWTPFPKPPLKLFNSDKLPLGPFSLKIDSE
ncbi:MAG: sialate O-acetylesterase [Luteolibacter sp.]